MNFTSEKAKHLMASTLVAQKQQLGMGNLGFLLRRMPNGNGFSAKPKKKKENLLFSHRPKTKAKTQCTCHTGAQILGS